jgi:hypothetical protein
MQDSSSSAIDLACSTAQIVASGHRQRSKRARIISLFLVNVGGLVLPGELNRDGRSSCRCHPSCRAYPRVPRDVVNDQDIISFPKPPHDVYNRRALPSKFFEKRPSETPHIGDRLLRPPRISCIAA